ncbi:MAG: stage II sporulation protein M [Moorellales bacterium]
MWGRPISSHSFPGDPRFFLLVAVFFLGGLTAGAAVVHSLNAEQSAELSQFLDLSLAGLVSGSLEGMALVRKAWGQNLSYVLLLGFLGLTAVGVPAVLALLAWRGFTLGFTVGFLITDKAGTGLLLSALAVLPANVFYVPGFLLVGTGAATLSWHLMRGGRFSFPLSWWEQFRNYLAVVVVAMLLVGVGGLIEAYAAPAVIRWLLSPLLPGGRISDLGVELMLGLGQ